MSFIDTIALPLFIAIVGLIALVFIVAWAYSQTTEARSKMMERKRDLRLEQQQREFIERLFIESNSSTDSTTLSPELAEQLWKVHDRIDQKKELTQ